MWNVSQNEVQTNLQPLVGVQANMIYAEFPTAQFDAIIDKACLDAILCHAYGDSHARKYLAQVER